MEFEFEAADDEFSHQVRRVVTRQLDALAAEEFADPRRIDVEQRRSRRWTQMLDDAGYLIHRWPAEWGGATWPPRWARLLEDELVAAQAPVTDAIGVGFVGPMICKYGSPTQKARYLPRIRRAADLWCQGFSEAHAGSDTMAIRTRATRDRGGFIVNGQKLWTTSAHIADMMFALVKSDASNGRPLPGVTLLLIDMRSPGLTVRPVILIDGQHLVNEVTLENVRVPAENLIGEEGRGWIYARSVLADERSIVAHLGGLKQGLKRLRTILARRGAGDGFVLRRCSSFDARLVEMEAEFAALEFMELRMLHAQRGDASVQVFPPMLKLCASELWQRLSELVIEALGERAVEMPGTSAGEPGTISPPADLGMATSTFLSLRAATILGGTSEIQRNIIAGIGLGV